MNESLFPTWILITVGGCLLGLVLRVVGTPRLYFAGTIMAYAGVAMAFGMFSGVHSASSGIASLGLPGMLLACLAADLAIEVTTGRPPELLPLIYTAGAVCVAVWLALVTHWLLPVVFLIGQIGLTMIILRDHRQLRRSESEDQTHGLTQNTMLAGAAVTLILLLIVGPLQYAIGFESDSQSRSRRRSAFPAHERMMSGPVEERNAGEGDSVRFTSLTAAGKIGDFPWVIPAVGVLVLLGVLYRKPHQAIETRHDAASPSSAASVTET